MQTLFLFILIDYDCDVFWAVQFLYDYFSYLSEKILIYTQIAIENILIQNN